MPPKKLYIYQDKNLDREMVEIYTYLQKPGVGLPVFADNATALAGGLTVNMLYRTADGTLKVVY